ncbi:MAG: hypothetical protein OXU69_09335 [Gemmatimonadota bacterium]|nr:hypothetical protein [Gemmatimonadota bacterium]MDE2984895.1 hypothetical protein [Gemmatimonadota bacterium]
MSMDILGNLGEFIGALGVVFSLLLVARQMRLGHEQTRRNTRSVRAATFNSMVENSIRLLEHVFRDSELADFVARAAEDPDRLDAGERLRWDSYMTAGFRHFSNLLYQRETGAMEEKMWESYRRSFKDHLRNEGWVRWYLANPHLFDERLADEVRCILRELANEGVPHAVKWKADGGRVGFRAVV